MIIKPTLVAIDETEDFSPEIQDAAGRIEVVYLYDRNQATYCCEITPSYALYPVYYLAERRVTDEIDSDIRQGIGHEVTYIHTHSVEQFPTQTCPTEVFKKSEVDPDEAWEALLEYHQGNWGMQASRLADFSFGEGFTGYAIYTNPEKSYIQGRNGCADIKKVTVWTNDASVSIGGISAKRGVKINGQITLTVKAMDDLCRLWQQREEIKAASEREDQW